MNSRYVLRNYLAQQAMDAAHQGDMTLVNRLLGVPQKPYADQTQHADLTAPRPDWARNKPGCSALYCSS